MMVAAPVMPMVMALPIIAIGGRNKHEGSRKVSFTNSSDPVFDLPGRAILLAQAVSRLGAACEGKGQRSGEGESFNAALHNHANLRFLHLTI